MSESNPRLGRFVETSAAGEVVRAFVPPPLPPRPPADMLSMLFLAERALGRLGGMRSVRGDTSDLKWRASVREFWENVLRWLCFNPLIVPIEIEIANHGTAPAERVRLRVDGEERIIFLPQHYESETLIDTLTKAAMERHLDLPDPPVRKATSSSQVSDLLSAFATPRFEDIGRMTLPEPIRIPHIRSLDPEVWQWENCDTKFRSHEEISIGMFRHHNIKKIRLFLDISKCLLPQRLRLRLEASNLVTPVELSPLVIKRTTELQSTEIMSSSSLGPSARGVWQEFMSGGHTDSVFSSSGILDREPAPKNSIGLRLHKKSS